jgi:hypothetical protein
MIAHHAPPFLNDLDAFRRLEFGTFRALNIIQSDYIGAFDIQPWRVFVQDVKHILSQKISEGRIRTCVCGNQSPVLGRLATSEYL